VFHLILKNPFDNQKGGNIQTLVLYIQVIISYLFNMIEFSRHNFTTQLYHLAKAFSSLVYQVIKL